MKNMPKDELGSIAQVFPLTQGNVELTSGNHEGYAIICCSEEGDITLNWEDQTSTPVHLLVGDFFAIHAAKSVTITLGKFHLA